MGASLSILTSGFLVTVVIFLLLMGILFYTAWSKMGAVLLENDPARNDLTELDEALNDIRVAYIAAFIAAFLALVLAVLYAGHETVINPSEYFHLALFVLVYIAWIVSAVYAYIALNKLYNTRITQRNGADAYIWAGMLLAIFAFVALTASGSGRIGYNVVRANTRQRVEAAEHRIHTQLPAIHDAVVDTHNVVAGHVPLIHGKVNDLHVANGLSAPLEQQYVVSQQVVPQQQYVVSQAPIASPQLQSSPQYVSQIAQPSALLLPQTFSGTPCAQQVQSVRRI